MSARSRGDLALIAQALKSEDQPVEAAGVAPTREQLQLFARANGLRLRETAEDFQLARRRAPRGRVGGVRAWGFVLGTGKRPDPNSLSLSLSLAP